MRPISVVVKHGNIKDGAKHVYKGRKLTNHCETVAAFTSGSCMVVSVISFALLMTHSWICLTHQNSKARDPLFLRLHSNWVEGTEFLKDSLHHSVTVWSLCRTVSPDVTPKNKIKYTLIYLFYTSLIKTIRSFFDWLNVPFCTLDSWCNNPLSGSETASSQTKVVVFQAHQELLHSSISWPNPSNKRGMLIQLLISQYILDFVHKYGHVHSRHNECLTSFERVLHEKVDD